MEEAEASAERRRARRERHERHKRERSGEVPPRSGRSDRSERSERRRRRDRESHSESDSTDDDSADDERPKMLESTPKAVMSGGLGEAGIPQGGMGSLRENPDAPGQYTGYTRNPPPSSVVSGGVAPPVGSGRRDAR